MRFARITALASGLHITAAHCSRSYKPFERIYAYHSSDVFSTVSHNNGPKSKQYQYTRRLSDGPAYNGGYYGPFAPYYDIYHPDIRCGWGAIAHGAGVETLVVNAGDELALFAT